MSSTNRGSTRHPDDHYATPSWCVDALRLVLPRFDGLVIDAGCGEGAILEALGHAPVIGVELAHARAQLAIAKGHRIVEADFLAYSDRNVRAVIMNPPYKLAKEFVDHAMRLVQLNDGFVAALLRLPFLAGQKRRGWWQDNPADVYVLSRRPSFTGKGTDSCDYAWFVWGPGPRGRVTVL